MEDALDAEDSVFKKGMACLTLNVKRQTSNIYYTHKSQNDWRGLHVLCVYSKSGTMFHNSYEVWTVG